MQVTCFSDYHLKKESSFLMSKTIKDKKRFNSFYEGKCRDNERDNSRMKLKEMDRRFFEEELEEDRF